MESVSGAGIVIVVVILFVVAARRNVRDSK